MVLELYKQNSNYSLQMSQIQFFFVLCLMRVALFCNSLFWPMLTQTVAEINLQTQLRTNYGFWLLLATNSFVNMLFFFSYFKTLFLIVKGKSCSCLDRSIFTEKMDKNEWSLMKHIKNECTRATAFFSKQPFQFC